MAAEKIKDKQITRADRSKKIRSKKTQLIIDTAIEHPTLTTREIGAIANCSHVNVVNTLQRYGIDHGQLQDFKAHRADVIAGLQHRLLVSVTDADIQKAPLGSRILAAAQLYDKERLERGQSTSNINYLDVSKRLEELQARKAKLLANSPDVIDAELSTDSQIGDNVVDSST